MQSEPAIESPAEGPVFVDNSGRRSKALRRIGLLVGVGCLAYAVVLGAAFMGWGSSLTPSSLLPFGRGGQGQGPGGGLGPEGGRGDQVGGNQTGGAPTGAPPALPSGTTPTSTPSPSTSPSAPAG